MSDPIIRASWTTTAVFAATATGAASTKAMRGPATVVAIALFVLGTGLFIAALVLAADRSRREEIGMGGLFFLQGSAPRKARWAVLGSVVVQSVIALTTAAVRPYTSLAFGILVPMAGLGFAGMWGARNGAFKPRSPRR